MIDVSKRTLVWGTAAAAVGGALLMATTTDAGWLPGADATRALPPSRPALQPPAPARVAAPRPGDAANADRV